MVKKVTKRLRLNLNKIKSKARKEKAKEEIGNYLLKQIDSHLNRVKSPVVSNPKQKEGETFQGLSKKYKKIKKAAGAGSRANLLLEGDMRSQITYENYQGGIEIGVFDEQEAQKADNHNKFSAKSKKTPLPPRKFIPNKNEYFSKKIMDGVESIIKKYED